MPNREAVSVSDSIVIKGADVLDKVSDREPHSILFCVVEPSTGLPVQIDD
jgi:hypothetical protein